MIEQGALLHWSIAHRGRGLGVRGYRPGAAWREARGFSSTHRTISQKILGLKISMLHHSQGDNKVMHKKLLQ